MNKEDFLLYEDGVKQEIAHFSQDELPLSVVVAIDRGPACPYPIDVWSDEAHRAAREAIDLLKLVDEIAVMAFTDLTTVIQPFTRNRIKIEQALNNIPPPAKTTKVAHCFNLMFAAAADHMVKASNPAGRRVIIVITSMTRLFDCTNGPSNRAATTAVYEAGAVVCAVIPRVIIQQVENALQKFSTRVNKVVAANYMDQKFAPLLSHGPRQIAVAMQAFGRTRYLNLDIQQGQRDCENGIAEALEAVEPAVGAVRFRVGVLATVFAWRHLSRVPESPHKKLYRGYSWPQIKSAQKGTYCARKGRAVREEFSR